MDREALPTYYPGDIVRINLEVRHRPNLENATARFVVHPEREGAVAFPREVWLSGRETLEISTDGTKLSRLVFDLDTMNSNIESGAVFELREVTAETTGRQSMILDLAEVQTPRFRFALEPQDSTPVVKHASTERI